MSDIVEVMADGIRNVIDTGDRDVIEAAARAALTALSEAGWVVVKTEAEGFVAVEEQVRAPRATTGIPHPQEPYSPEPPKERT